MSKPAPPVTRAKTAMTGSERQQRYRAAKQLCSIDIRRNTLIVLETLRGRLSTSVDETVAKALVLLDRETDPALRAAAAAGSPAQSGRRNRTLKPVTTVAAPPADTSPGDVIFSPSDADVTTASPTKRKARASRKATERTALQSDLFGHDLSATKDK